MTRRKKTFASRLRTRGGLSVRKQWTRITSDVRSRYRCPRCANVSVRREGVGIWSCTKCGYRFTGGAYQPSTKMGQSSTRIR